MKIIYYSEILKKNFDKKEDLIKAEADYEKNKKAKNERLDFIINKFDNIMKSSKELSKLINEYEKDYFDNISKSKIVCNNLDDIFKLVDVYFKK